MFFKRFLLIAACLLGVVGCAAITTPVKGVQAASSVPGANEPVNGLTLWFYPSNASEGNVSRYIEPVTIYKDHFTDAVFPCQSANSEVTSVEWVLSSASASYEVVDGVMMATCESATFVPYHFYGTAYGGSGIEWSPFHFVFYKYPSSAYDYGARFYTSLGQNVRCHGNAFSVPSGGSSYGWDAFGYYSSFVFNTTASGPYYLGVDGFNLNGSNYSFAWCLDKLCALQSGIQAAMPNDYDAGYSEGYVKGYNYGNSVGYDRGYSVGYADGYDIAEDTGPGAVITSLFGGIVSVPFNVLNGLNGFAFWDTPITVIIVSFLFMALVLIFLKKFLR